MPKAALLMVSTLASSLLISSYALASGGGGYGGGGFSTSRTTKTIDRTYEYGKTLYKGQARGVEKVKYCLSQGENSVGIKRKTLKPYKGKSFNALAKDLHNCDSPENSIFNYMTSAQVGYVVYYLDKRFKLKMKKS